jgi:peptide/nickel transport system substrate-binding protein
MNRATRFTLVIAGCSAALVLSACSDSGGGKSDEPAAVKAGGTLYVLNSAQAAAWDPQRISVVQQNDFAGRVFSRTLTARTPDLPGSPGKLVGDLATNTGTPSDGAKTWKFTLRDDVKWQDGKPVTCQDVKYGISRTFATGQITGGLTYAMSFLDVPTGSDGASLYQGPYTGKGQKYYDRAVSCQGRTITFHLKTPMSDFNETLGMQVFAPYRKDKDTGAKGVFTVFSDGPYKLQGSWSPDKGATFVRNPEWSADSDPVRRAYPDQIVYREGLDLDSIGERLIADAGADKDAVTQEALPSTTIARIAGDPTLQKRMVDPDAPYVDYLAPNFRSTVMKNPKARQALAMSTDRGAYITALGGPELNSPMLNILAKNLPAYQEFEPFGASANGDPQAARQVLESSGLDLPVPITVTYLKSAESDKAFAALAQGWEKAGFKVTLDGISQNYYAAIASPTMATKSDVFWSIWGAYWPSGYAVLPQLFDGRINISAAGSGADPGYFDNAAIDAKMDQATVTLDPEKREQAWGDISRQIADLGGYIALSSSKSYALYGSSVENYAVDGFGSVDLAAIAVR